MEITKVLRVSRLCAEILSQDPHNTKEECHTLDRDFRFLLVRKQCSLSCSQQLRLYIYPESVQTQFLSLRTISLQDSLFYLTSYV
jgi:hypothetical protein